MNFIKFIKYYYEITNDKFIDGTYSNASKITKQSRIYYVIINYILLIASIVFSIYTTKEINGYYIFILPIILYATLISNCGFSLILCFILYVRARRNNSYIRLLYSNFYGYNLPVEITKKSNNLIKKCSLYSELHKTLIKAKYLINIGKKDEVLMILKGNQVILEYKEKTLIIKEKIKEKEELIEKIFLNIADMKNNY